MKTHIKPIRRSILAAILAASMLLCACLDRLSLLESNSQKEHKAMKAFEETFFTALEKKDEKAIRQCFSKSAIERTSDLDEGFAYIFDLLGGKKVEIQKDNLSAYQTYERRANTWEIRCYCNFTSEGKSYRLHWNQYLQYEPDPKMEGVYSLIIFEAEEGEPAPFTLWNLAGIEHPGRMQIITALNYLRDLDEQGVQYHLKEKKSLPREEYVFPEDEELRKYFDAEYLSSMDGDEKRNMLALFKSAYSVDYNSAWLAEDGEELCAFVQIRFAMQDYCLGIRFNDSGLICGMNVRKNDKMPQNGDLEGFVNAVGY